LMTPAPAADRSHPSVLPVRKLVVRSYESIADAEPLTLAYGSDVPLPGWDQERGFPSGQPGPDARPVLFRSQGAARAAQCRGSARPDFPLSTFNL